MSEVQSPVIKSVAGLGSAAGSSAMSKMTESYTFLPTDLAGWMAVAASTLAVGYTATIWVEWWWKKFWKPWLKRRRWVKRQQYE